MRMTTRRIWCLVFAVLILVSTGCGTGTYNDRYEQRGGDLIYDADN